MTFPKLTQVAPRAYDSLGADVDLDTVTTTGLYFQNADRNATLELNYPEARSGFLEVHNSTGTTIIYQRYTTLRNALYMRRFYNSSWSGWVQATNFQ